MDDDPLELAYAIGLARQTIGVNMAAEGAEPSTAAERAGFAVDVGAIVRDGVTGQVGVVSHASVQTVDRVASKQA